MIVRYKKLLIQTIKTIALKGKLAFSLCSSRLYSKYFTIISDTINTYFITKQSFGRIKPFFKLGKREFMSLNANVL